MVCSQNSKSLYVLNELSGHVTQYAIDTGKGTLTLVDRLNSVPNGGRTCLGPGTGSGLALLPPRSIQDDKPKSGQPISKSRPTANSCIQRSARPTRSLCSRRQPIRAGSPMSPNYATESQPRGIRIDPTGHYLVAFGEKSDGVSVSKIDQTTGKLGEAIDTRSGMVRTGWRSSNSNRRERQFVNFRPRAVMLGAFVLFTDQSK